MASAQLGRRESATLMVLRSCPGANNVHPSGGNAEGDIPRYISRKPMDAAVGVGERQCDGRDGVAAGNGGVLQYFQSEPLVAACRPPRAAGPNKSDKAQE